MEPPIRVVVTGAAGHVAYTLLYTIGRGDVFGKNQPIILHLLEIPEGFEQLKGVVMELMDCNLALIKQFVPTTDAAVAFKNVSVAILCGGAARNEHIKVRTTLLPLNILIFKAQGRALDRYARKNVKVLVVANPCNTNALICMHYAPTIPPENFTALTRLDQNRSLAVLADKLVVPVAAIKNVFTWGNHSVIQLPDAKNATFKKNGNSQRVWVAINDKNYLETEYLEKITQRGNDLLSARKQTSGLSAAKAVSDHMHDWWHGTAPGEYVSMAVLSDGSYGVAKNVFFSFPVSICCKNWTIVKDLYLDDFSRERLRANGRQLLQEKAWALKICEEDDKREAERNSSQG